MKVAFAPPAAECANAGFSLSEALVAIFLLALAAMVIVGTLPQRPEAGTAAAERLRKDFGDIRDLAIISGHAQAIRLRDDGYEHLAWHNDGWSPASRHAVRLDHDVTIALEKAKPRSRFDTKTREPEIVFDPTGIVESPNLVLMWDSGTLPLSILPDGEVVWDSGNV